MPTSYGDRPLRTRSRGFTLVETVMAMGLCVGALTVFYLSVAQAIRVVRAAKEDASASQLLEQRFESFRTRALWTDIITTSGLQALVTKDLAAGGPLANAVETYAVSTYPAGALAFTVRRNADGTISTSGSSLQNSEKSVRISGGISWGATSRRPRTRSIATVFTQGGV